MLPAVLVTLGLLFLLGTLTDGRLDFSRSWPLLLIVAGAVKLAQRSASTAGHVEPQPQAYIPGQPMQVVPTAQYQPATEPPTPGEQRPPSSEVNHG